MMRFEGRPLDDSDPLFAPLIALDRKRGTAFWRPSAKWKKAGYKGGAVRLSGVLGDGLDAMRAGASDYLLKPCPVEELLERIENVYERLLEEREAKP